MLREELSIYRQMTIGLDYMSKIRGWKRRKRMLDKWSSAFDHYHFTRLLEIEHESAKLFSFLKVEEFPNWYKEDVLQKLVEVKVKWGIQARKEIKGRHLFLVIIDLQNILSSEVVIVMDERIEQYKNIYPIELDYAKIPLWMKENEHFDRFKPFKKIYTLSEEDISYLGKEEIGKLNIIEENESFEKKWYTIEEGTILIWYEEIGWD